jgi:hypothetical protein
MVQETRFAFGTDFPSISAVRMRPLSQIFRYMALSAEKATQINAATSSNSMHCRKLKFIRSPNYLSPLVKALTEENLCLANSPNLQKRKLFFEMEVTLNRKRKFSLDSTE